MKSRRFIVNSRYLLSALALTLTLCAFAQAQAPQPQTASAVPVSRVAVIYSVDFQDPKTGIAKFIVLFNKLNGEFQKVQDELNQTANSLKQLQNEISQGVSPTMTAAQLQQKMDLLDLQKRIYQRKGEDTQAAYGRRRQELFTPLQDDITKAMDVYAKAHGITLIIDGSQMQLLYAADGIDITRAFISDYNIKNPATATTP